MHAVTTLQQPSNGALRKGEDPSIKFSVQTFMSHKTGETIDSHYDLGRVLGEGAFGEVFLGVNKQSKEERAVKKMEKDPRDQEMNDEILHEFNVLKKLDHPNVLKVYDLYEDPSDFYIVTDLYGGGDLFEYLEEREYLPEDDVKVLMNKLLSCMTYMHQTCHMVHRDLKLENILLDDNQDLKDMKLIDFGLVAHYEPDKKETMTFDALCGSTSYIAPQVVEGEYTVKCDIWSCGVIAFCLLAGYTPFDAGDDGAIIQAILVGKFDFDDEVWDTVSDEAKDFICNMLAYDEIERPTAEQALTHPWLQKLRTREMKETSQARSVSIRESLTALRRFSTKGQKLKQATCAILASQLLKKDEKDAFTDGFRYLNPSLTGNISKKDLEQVIEELGGSANKKAAVDSIFEQVNFSASGAISYSEYAVAMLFERKLIKNKLKLVFDILDSDKDGNISVQDLQESLAMDDANVCSKMMEPFIADGEQTLSFDEFKNAILEKFGTMDGSVALLDDSTRMDDSSRVASTRRGPENFKAEVIEEKPKDNEKQVKPVGPEGMTLAKKQECYMWYARFGFCSRDKMIRHVIKLQKSGDSDCKITPEDVKALPWLCGGALISVKEMNRVNEMVLEDDSVPVPDPTVTTVASADSDNSFSRLEEEVNITKTTKKEVEAPKLSAKPAIKAIPRPGAKKPRLKVSTVLSMGRGSSHSLTTETAIDASEHSSGEDQTIVRSRVAEKRADVSIFSNKKKPPADWVSLGKAKLMIASYEERQKNKPDFAFKSIVKADLSTCRKAYRARMEKLEERANEEAIEKSKKEAEVRHALEAAARVEQERLAKEKAKADRLAKEKAAKAEAKRLAQEAAAKAEAERLEQEAAAKAEAERLAEEAAAKVEAERLAQEAAARAEAERLAQEAAAKAEAERLAQEAATKTEADEDPARVEVERLAKEAGVTQAETEKTAQEGAKIAETGKLPQEATTMAEEDRFAQETKQFAKMDSSDSKLDSSSEEQTSVGSPKKKKNSVESRPPRVSIFAPSALSDESRNRQFPSNRRRSSTTKMDSSDKGKDHSTRRRSSINKLDASDKSKDHSARRKSRAPKD